MKLWTWITKPFRKKQRPRMKPGALDQAVRELLDDGIVDGSFTAGAMAVLLQDEAGFRFGRQDPATAVTRVLAKLVREERLSVVRQGKRGAPALYRVVVKERGRDERMQRQYSITEPQHLVVEQTDSGD